MEPRIKENLRTYQRDTYTQTKSAQLTEHQVKLDCALGTNPYGCSPLVLASPPPPQELFLSYPTPQPGFIQKLLEYWQDVASLSPVNIQLEVGTFGVIERLNKLFIDNKSVVLGYCPQFSDFGQDILCCGGQFEHINLNPAHNYKFSADELISAMSSRYKLIYLDNPNNPTGQVIPLSQIEAVLKAAQDVGSVVLVDEAYGDFMAKENSSISLIPHYSNLVVARSFTKAYGLAGLRIGYAIMSTTLSEPFSLVAHPFPVTALGQYYAQIALEDHGFIQNCKQKFRTAKANLRQCCQRLQIPETHPDNPLLTLIHPNPGLNLYNEFLARGVLATSGQHFTGLGRNAVRIRLPKDQQQLFSIVKEIEALR